MYVIYYIYINYVYIMYYLCVYIYICIYTYITYITYITLHILHILHIFIFLYKHNNIDIPLGHILVLLVFCILPRKRPLKIQELLSGPCPLASSSTDIVWCGGAFPKLSLDFMLKRPETVPYIQS